MKIYEIIEFMEKFAPKELAEEWDNVGLLIGKPEYNVNKILVSLDVNNEVVDEAIDKNVDLIITHHPVIFKPLKNISNDIFIKLLKNNISVYSAHTNLDVTNGGVNDAFAKKINLENIYRIGMLRVGKVAKITLSEFVNKIKKVFNVNGVRVCGANEKTIEKVAVLGGSGGDLIYELNPNICDAFLTGEASYHHAQYADENNIALISIGHFETENPVVEKLVEIIKQNFNIEVLASNEKNVYNIR